MNQVSVFSGNIYHRTDSSADMYSESPVIKGLVNSSEHIKSFPIISTYDRNGSTDIWTLGICSAERKTESSAL